MNRGSRMQDKMRGKQRKTGLYSRPSCLTRQDCPHGMNDFDKHVSARALMIIP